MIFKTNMSKADRGIRTVMGCIFLTIAFTEILFADPMSKILIGIVGTIALFSALTRYCLLYELTGLATYKPTR
jgi:Inner membrane protein YgaP-like, transmembrane domain